MLISSVGLMKWSSELRGFKKFGILPISSACSCINVRVMPLHRFCESRYDRRYSMKDAMLAQVPTGGQAEESGRSCISWQVQSI